MPITDEQIVEWFTYHPPTPEQIEDLVTVRTAAQNFAKLLIRCSPACADQTAAMRKLRECVMTINAAIILQGK